MEKVLITGGLGFIGSHLTQAIAASGRRIVILDNLSPQIHGDGFEPGMLPEGIELLRGDVRDAALLERALEGVKDVVHLAAETGTGQSMYRISEYSSANIQGTSELLQAIRNRKTRPATLVLASSRSVYGEGAHSIAADGALVTPSPRSAEQLARSEWEHLSPSGQAMLPVPTPEASPLCPASVYAATKAAQELLVESAALSMGLCATIFRFQNVYGEGQSMQNPYTGILSIFANRARQGLELPVFEDGLETRDFVHVSDIVGAIQLGLKRSGAGTRTYNVGSGVQTSVLEVATQVARFFPQSPGPRVTGDYRIGDIRHCYADLSKIRSELGFNPVISFEEGIKRFLTWASAQPLFPDRLEAANAELRQFGLMK
jgi:dTDP-L-rhamnose 4-epimerase